MQKLPLIILSCLLISAFNANGLELSQTSKSKLSADGFIWLAYANTISVDKKEAAINRLDPVLTSQMGAARSIKAEKDVQLRRWMMAISGLAMNGNVVAAQNLINEVAKTGAYKGTAFPVLKGLIEESTSAPIDDAEYQKANLLYANYLNKLPKTNNRNHFCGTVLLKAELFDDSIARSFAKDCFIGDSAKTTYTLNLAEDLNHEMSSWRNKTVSTLKSPRTKDEF